MNLTYIRSVVSAKISLTNTVQGEQSLIDAWANEAVLDILQKTRCYVRRATMNMTEGEEDHEFPQAILSVIYMRSTAGTSQIPFRQVTIYEIEQMRMASSSPNGGAQFYTVLGNDFFSVYPTPGPNEVITIHYVPQPQTMTDGLNDPSVNIYGGLPTWTHKAIEWYCLREAADYDSHGPSKNGAEYNMRYSEHLAWINKMVKQQGGSLLPEAVLWRAGRVPGQHDPSADVYAY